MDSPHAIHCRGTVPSEGNCQGLQERAAAHTTHRASHEPKGRARSFFFTCSQTLCQPPVALLASSLVPSGALLHIASSRPLNTHLSRSVPYTDLHWLPTTLRTKIPIMTLSIHALIPAHPCSHVPHTSLSSCF